MARPLIAGLAPGLILQDGYVIQLVALDPTTGNAVTGVNVSNVALQVDTLTEDDQGQQEAALPPLFATVPTP